MAFAEEVRGGTVSFTEVSPTDVFCGKWAPVGPESSSRVVAAMLPPVGKDWVGAVHPGRPVGSSRNGLAFAPGAWV